LSGKGSDEPISVTEITAASREEKAGAETAPVVVGPGDGRLAGVRNSIQLEHAPLVVAVGPFLYFLKELRSSIWKADWLVLIFERVEGRLSGNGQCGDNLVEPCILFVLLANVFLNTHDSVISLAVRERHEDIEDAQEAIRLVLFPFCLSVLRPRESFGDTEVG
jgi:hypothetical protein